MKKLLVLMLVLGLASVANAALTIGVYETDGTTLYDSRAINVGENLMLKIIAVGGDTGDFGGIALIADTTLGIVGTTGTTHIPPAPDASALLGGATGNFVGGMGANDDGIVGSIAAFTAQPPHEDGVYFSDILFTCAGEGPVTVYLYDIGTTWSIADGLIDSAVINQVPEPMTIALMGLGSLFLLRRRK
ncbi:MAG: PEP-CTERM sorting domain-containing protein [Planctomycetota bacterium]|jgi:hypothetical protein